MFGIEIESWHLWIIAGLILAMAELAGAGFVAVALAAACILAGLLSAMFGLSWEAEIWVAIGGALIMTPWFVWFYRTRVLSRKGKGPLDSGWERGLRATAESYHSRIGVRLKGDFYPARYADGETPAEGRRLVVERLEGITAIVRPRRETPAEAKRSEVGGGGGEDPRPG